MSNPATPNSRAAMCAASKMTGSLMLSLLLTFE